MVSNFDLLHFSLGFYKAYFLNLLKADDAKKKEYVELQIETAFVHWTIAFNAILAQKYIGKGMMIIDDMEVFLAFNYLWDCGKSTLEDFWDLFNIIEKETLVMIELKEEVAVAAKETKYYKEFNS